jgi:hypothetical protein
VTGRVECLVEPGQEETIAGGAFNRYRIVVKELENLEVLVNW